MSFRPLRAIVRLTLMEALRTRLPLYGALLLAAVYGLAALFGAMAVTEGDAVRAGVSGSLLRLGLVVLLALFVVASVHREQESRATERMLSLPLSRAAYYLARLAGFAITAVVMAALAAALAGLHAAPGSSVPWGLSLAAELVLVAALAQAAAFALGQLPGALGAVLAFYLLARGMGAIQLIAHGSLLSSTGPFNATATAVVDAVAYGLPDLYRFTRAEWLIYGPPEPGALALVLGQGALYGLLLLAVGLFDLYRRSF